MGSFGFFNRLNVSRIRHLEISFRKEINKGKIYFNILFYFVFVVQKCEKFVMFLQFSKILIKNLKVCIDFQNLRIYLKQEKELII